MARPKQFDIEEKLDLAADLFWRQGYANTSLADLETHLSIGRKSIYDTFGDKFQLFLSVLDSYLRIPYPIANQDAGWAEIEAQFHQSPAFNNNYKSCLFANTIQEFGLEENVEVRTRIYRHIERLDRCFTQSLNNSIANGQLGPINVSLMAKYLTANLQSLSMMAKAGCSKKELHELADLALNSVRNSAS